MRISFNPVQLNQRFTHKPGLNEGPPMPDFSKDPLERAIEKRDALEQQNWTLGSKIFDLQQKNAKLSEKNTALRKENKELKKQISELRDEIYHIIHKSS